MTRRSTRQAEIAHRLIGDGSTITVLTLNAWYDPVERAARQRSAAALIKESGAAVVMLQELPPEHLEEQLSRITDGTGMHVAGIGFGQETCTAVLTSADSTPLPAILAPDSDAFRERSYAAAGITIRGVSFVAVSVHAPWGGSNEPARVHAVQLVDAAVRDWLASGAYEGAVIAGDFNAEPDAESIRYLTASAVVDGRGAHWVDAWALCGQGPGTTSSAENPWALRVAAAHVEIPELIMDRRIDYVFVYGWAYGRKLTPLACTVHERREHGGSNPSDHWAVSAALYLPRAV